MDILYQCVFYTVMQHIQMKQIVGTNILSRLLFTFGTEILSRFKPTFDRTEQLNNDFVFRNGGVMGGRTLLSSRTQVALRIRAEPILFRLIDKL